MKTLSERLLESADLKESHVGDDGFAWFINSDEVRGLLREAAEIIRRVEEAPMYTVSWSDEAAAYVIDLPGSGGPDKRVRIVEE